MATREVVLAGKKAAGRVTVVDEADFALASSCRWRIWEKARPGSQVWGPYAVTGPSSAGLHTLLTGWPLVDHANANGDGLDNRRSNLRPATVAENSQNRVSVPGSSSCFKGVCWNQGRGKWQADIKVNGKSRYLGIFIDEVQAARAYDEAAREAYGAFARLNFPEVA